MFTLERAADGGSAGQSLHKITEKGEKMRYASSMVIASYSRTSQKLYLLLCESKQEFLAGKLVLPGGKVEEGETARVTALREIGEEVGLDLTDYALHSLPVADAVDRDPRGRVVDAPFLVVLDSDEFDQTPEPGDDIATCRWYSIDEITPDDLGFDHALIIKTAFVLMRAIPVEFSLWPITFTIQDYVDLKVMVDSLAS